MVNAIHFTSLHFTSLHFILLSLKRICILQHDDLSICVDQQLLKYIISIHVTTRGNNYHNWTVRYTNISFHNKIMCHNGVPLNDVTSSPTCIRASTTATSALDPDGINGDVRQVVAPFDGVPSNLQTQCIRDRLQIFGKYWYARQLSYVLCLVMHFSSLLST